MNEEGRAKEWVIVVAQHVTGKSKFPRGFKFKRVKPFPYRDSNKPHRIVYARYFVSTEQEAKERGELIDEKMFDLYVTSLGNTQHYCVSDYTMVLHDITTDTSQQLSTTIADDNAENPGYLYEGWICSNRLLSKWGIVKGF
jgi:hypothetical protein